MENIVRPFHRFPISIAGQVIFTLLVSTLAARSLAAHDLWLVPDEGKSNAPLRVWAISGMKFPVGDVGPDPGKFIKRWVLDPKGRELACDPVHPALDLCGKPSKQYGLMQCTPTQPGIHIVAVQTQARVLELDAEAFNHYLVADGLPHIYLQRHEDKTLQQKARERYSKSPKAIFAIGDAGQGRASVVLGLPLEIVPLTNPFRLKPGETLPIRVLFQGKPLPEANVGWDYPGAELTPRGTARTDAAGEALIPISRTGLNALRLTHMTRPRTSDYEWESFWTTLTWRIPQNPPIAEPATRP